MSAFHFFVLFLSSVLFGAVIGAYLGTADYRIRHDEPVITSKCYCPECHHTLAGIYQIPVISWFLLGGRCHYCHAPIPLRYPLIEGGFLLYYGTTFLLLWKYPVSLLMLWFGMLCITLFLRCQGHYRSLVKGLSVFAGYHLFYGIAFLSIYAALGLL